MPNGPLDGSSFNESMYEYVNNGNDRQDDVGASGGGNGGGGGGGNGGGGAGGGGANISKGKQKEKRQSRNPGVRVLFIVFEVLTACAGQRTRRLKAGSVRQHFQ